MRTAGVVRWIGSVDCLLVGHLVPLEGRGPSRSGSDPGECLFVSDVNWAGAGEQSRGTVALLPQPPRRADSRMTRKGQLDGRGEDLDLPDIWIFDENRLGVANGSRDLLPLVRWNGLAIDDAQQVAELAGLVDEDSKHIYGEVR
jgi:hypothetical protein